MALTQIDHDQFGAHVRVSFTSLTNTSGASRTAGDVVVQDPASANAFTTTTTQGDTRPVFVVVDTSIASSATGYVAGYGIVTVNVQGNVALGNSLRSSTTAGRAEDAGATLVTGAFARALTSFTGTTGTVTALLFGVTSSTRAFAGCFAYRSSSQSIADNTDTAITWDSEDYDTDTIHDTSTNPSRFTVPAGLGGHWRFVFAISWLDDFTTSGVTIDYRIKRNGSVFIQQGAVLNETANNKPVYNVQATLNLAVSDYVELAIQQNDGAARRIHGSATRRSFAMAEFAGA